MAITVVAIDLVGVEHAPVDLLLFAVGWSMGWLLLARPRDLAAETGERRIDGDARSSVAIVIPARDEADSLPSLLEALRPQLRPGDRVVVVDDHSTDATAAVATDHAAHVIAAPDLPAGWLGKPHACHVGASATEQPTLLFLDADVVPGPDLVDSVACAVAARPDAVVSLQPWHDMATIGERLGLLFNVTALMGCGAFTALGRRTSALVAFGPVLAVDRATYDAAGGHGSASVRSAHVEDIALARTVGRSVLFAGRATTTRFRMYPGGIGDLLRGWTRNLAAGARAVPWWLSIAVAVWVASLVGGPIALPAVAPLCALQVTVLGRRAGRTGVLWIVLFPVLALVLVAVTVVGVTMRATRRSIGWKGRRVPLGETRR